MASFRKGDLVQLLFDVAKVWKEYSQEEREQAELMCRGKLDDAGESVLPGFGRFHHLYRDDGDRFFVVLRGRCRVKIDYGRHVGKMCKIMDTRDGNEYYISKNAIEVVV